MSNNNAQRIVGFLIAVALLVTAFSGLFPLSPLEAGASADPNADLSSTLDKRYFNIYFTDPNKNSELVSILAKDKVYDMSFRFYTSDDTFINQINALTGSASFTTNRGWKPADSASIAFSVGAKIDSTYVITVNIKGIVSTESNRSLSISDITDSSANTLSNLTDIQIPESFFTPTTKPINPVDPNPINPDDDENTTKAESSTILENYIVTDKSGKKLEEINKETPAFNLTITYLEYGLERVDLKEMSNGDYSVFFSNMGGFFSETGTRGKLERIASSTNGIPRFRASFTNLTYNEDEGSNTVELKMVYDIEDHYTNGTLPLIVKQAKVKKEGDEEKEIAPLKPYLIVEQFSYGDDEIVAGSEFTLNIKYTNTSASIGLENIVMKITPPEDSITIASSSNTNYVAAIPAKGSLSHSIDLRAMPNAKIGSADVTVTFTYQYVDSVNKVREEVAELTQKISIPITQVDRFALDPIAEAPAYATVGEMFYIPISYINRGKSTTFNITATAKSKKEIEVRGEHGKNLEAGQSDSLEVGIICAAPGELIGTIEVDYEDEMGNQKTLNESFSLMVEEPYVPDMENEMPDTNETAPATSPVTIGLSIAGSVFIAVPATYYFIKRSQRKESEGFDEDF